MQQTAPADAALFTFTYPRVPPMRDPAAPTPLDVPTEHLVASARILESRAFRSDPGKGFLPVALASGLVVLNTHVTWGTPAAGQLADIATHVRRKGGPVNVGGDFNAEASTVAEVLGAEFMIGWPGAGTLPTRPRHDGRMKAQDIGHLLVWRGGIFDDSVIDGTGFSDHDPVAATVGLRSG